MSKSDLTIRKLAGAADLELVQTLEKKIWNLADIDVLSLTWAIASVEAGAIWIGAFDGEKLVGFAFAFPGISDGRVGFHSHQLGVSAEYRDSDIGFRLKVAQRQHVMAVRFGGSYLHEPRGAGGRDGESADPGRVAEITWTYDPLQSKNAHLNIFKLGVVCSSYKVDFYGPETSSVFHRNGTDRLWVKWPITSRRVLERLGAKKTNLRAEILDALSTVHPLILFTGDGRPAASNLEDALARQRIAIEIPSDINSVEQKAPELAREWRKGTRWAFTESFNAGFHIAEFCRTVRGQQGPGAYLLERSRVEDLL
jgi:predicted GNAT superfamily acetyltransferase